MRRGQRASIMVSGHSSTGGFYGDPFVHGDFWMMRRGATILCQVPNLRRCLALLALLLAACDAAEPATTLPLPTRVVPTLFPTGAAAPPRAAQPPAAQAPPA